MREIISTSLVFGWFVFYQTQTNSQTTRCSRYGVLALPVPPAAAALHITLAKKQIHPTPFFLSTSQTTMSGKYIVVFKDSATDADIDKYVNEVHSNGGSVGHRYNSVLRGFSAAIPDSYFMQLQTNPVIDYIEPDGVVTTQ